MTSAVPSIAYEPVNQVALEHLQRNVAALTAEQGFAMDLPTAPLAAMQWMAARDGTLTAQDAAGTWVTGCSLPRRAADAMLATMQSRRGAVCFLAPSHAAQLRAALARLDASQAVLAIIPEASAAAFVLAGDDFSREVQAGRLWVAVGTEWPGQLSKLFARHEGLPLPSSFIRLPILEDRSAEQLMQQAREVFNEETARRAARLEALRTQARRHQAAGSRRILVVAPTRFRLWDDAGWLMEQAMLRSARGDVKISTLDPDDPRQATPLALAAAAGGCDAILTANAYRSRMPAVLPVEVPWLTWATTALIAPPSADAPDDRLLLAEESLHEAALAAGWTVDRIHLATWPELAWTPAPTDAPLVVLGDTYSIDEPETPFDLSSHHVLWGLIRDEIRRNPFCIGNNLAGYLMSRIRQLGLDEKTVNTDLFIDRLIAPGFLQGVVQILLNNSVGLRVYGSGWDTLPPFEAVCGGLVQTRERFEQIIAGAGALLHPSPLKGAHLCHAYGRPVVHGLQVGPAGLVAAARQALSLQRAVALPSLSPLCAERLAQLCPAG